MKKYLFIFAVLTLLVITACGNETVSEITDTTSDVDNTQPIQEDIDTSEIDQLEKDLQDIEAYL